jgi:hypothetical protein
VIAPISTWVGFEISLIGDSLRNAAETAQDPVVREQLLAGAANPFNVFLHSIPYLFYPILAMSFVLMLALTGRDFGAMHRAEQRAASGGGLYRPGAMLAARHRVRTTSTRRPGSRTAGTTRCSRSLVVIVVALAGLCTTRARRTCAPEERSHARGDRRGRPVRRAPLGLVRRRGRRDPARRGAADPDRCRRRSRRGSAGCAPCCSPS